MTKVLKKRKLSKKSVVLLANFDKAAQKHGWESDQGSEINARRAENDYSKEKMHLINRLLDLEKKASQPKATLRLSPVQKTSTRQPDEELEALRKALIAESEFPEEEDDALDDAEPGSEF